jgi:hypothetical protein
MCVEERLSRDIVQAAEREFRQSCVIEKAVHVVTACHEHHDSLMLNASGDEGEHIGGGAIQPVRILYHNQQGSGLGRVR